MFENKKFDYVHISFIYTILFFNYLIFPHNISFTLSVIIPFIMWFITPLLFYWFSYNILQNKLESLLSTFTFIYGSYIIFFIGIVSIYAQYFSFLFYLISLSFYFGKYKNKFLSYLFTLISICYHPYTLFAYLVIILAIIYTKNKIISIIILPLFLLILSNFYPYSLFYYTIYGNHYWNPSYYQIFFLFFNPIFLYMSLVSLSIYKNWVDEHDKNYLSYNIYIFLFIVGVFSHIGRGLIYFIPLYSLFVGINLKTIYNKNKLLFSFLFIISLIHFYYTFNLYLDGMLDEFINPITESQRRNLNPDYLLTLLHRK